jgi:hypothetical protein
LEVEVPLSCAKILAMLHQIVSTMAIETPTVPDFPKLDSYPQSQEYTIGKCENIKVASHFSPVQPPVKIRSLHKKRKKRKSPSSRRNSGRNASTWQKDLQDCLDAEELRGRGVS